MDLYQLWFNLKDGIRDTEFSDRVHDYLSHLKDGGTIEVENLAQLDRAFDIVAARSGPAEALHHAVNSQVSEPVFALYRDFPDAVRVRGEEKF